MRMSNKTHKTYFNWSSGKDSAYALYLIQQDQTVRIEQLLTTVNQQYDRVSMHGLKRDVLVEQARSIGIPLDVLEVPEQPTMEEYNLLMKTRMSSYHRQGFTHAVFGDIFLEDLRTYREEMLSKLGIIGLFPIWKRDTKQLLIEMIELGFRTVIVCLNNNKLDASFLGKELTLELMDQFPAGVDPCGEHGEFHTFCFDGPIFSYPIEFELGEVVFKTYQNPTSLQDDIRFGFCDLVLKNTP